MVSNLLFRQMYDVGVLDGKYMLNGEKTSIKDVPFLRFRFNSYGDAEIEYIEKMLKKFEYSVGLCELHLSENTITEYNRLTDETHELSSRTAIYIYINIYDTDVLSGDVSQEVKELLFKIKENKIDYDKIMIKDMSSTLHSIAADKITGSIAKILGIKQQNVGICSSPLSFSESCCLTAIQARHLISIYSTRDDIKIPSANHQDMNTCGCIRHFEVTSDIPAPIKKANSGIKSSKNVEKNKGKDIHTSKKKTISKAPIEWV